MKIYLHIERITLAGVPVSLADAAVVRRAVRSELNGILRTPDKAAGWTATNAPRVEASSIRLSRQSSPRTLGTDLARSIGGAIRK